MKQSERRYFNHAGCDCRDCMNLRRGMRQLGYALMVAILLILSFGSLFVIAEVISQWQIGS
jgi:hypothetical protein